MECLQSVESLKTTGKVLCCQCGTAIDPNPANMCVPCIRTQVDITEGIPKQVIIYFCKGCARYLNPPTQWVVCALESRELLAFCLKKLKGLQQVNLVDASFVWTEPHSKRIKIRLTVQKEVMGGAILQQVFVVEYVVQTHMCNQCHRNECKDYWRAIVQVRQKASHKKTFLFLEQLILKHRAHAQCINIKCHHEGLDFFFAKKDEARKLVDFLISVVPCRYQTSQQLITHDTHNNTYTYKYSFSVEVVPVCKTDVVCLPVSLARSLGNIQQICICYKITNYIHLIDPNTLQLADVSSQQYWRTPFFSIGSNKQLTEYIVMNVEHVLDSERRTFAGQGPLSQKHVLSGVWVVRSSELGINDSQIYCRSHLGHLLKPGDTVLGLDIANSNVNNSELNKMKRDKMPDVVLVRKIFGDKTLRCRRRMWKLKHLPIDAETDNSSNVDAEYCEFLEDLEEDKEYRQDIDIYKDSKIPVSSDDVDEDFPQISLQEMLDDLTLDDIPMESVDEQGGQEVL